MKDALWGQHKQASEDRQGLLDGKLCGLAVEFSRCRVKDGRIRIWARAMENVQFQVFRIVLNAACWQEIHTCSFILSPIPQGSGHLQDPFPRLSCQLDSA